MKDVEVRKVLTELIRVLQTNDVISDNDVDLIYDGFIRLL